MKTRRLLLSDMKAAARVHRTSFDHALPWLTGLHTPEEDQWFYRERMFTTCTLWGAFDREFDRRSEQGLLGPIRRGSLINLARDLEDWFKNARPDAVRLSQAPNAKTIAKHLRPTFREYEKK